MEVAVLKSSGEKTAKKVNLSDEIFGIEPNDHAIYLDVKSYPRQSASGYAQVKAA